MNCNTGELIKLMNKDTIKLDDFDEVPTVLEKEALKLLGEKDSVFVDLQSENPLAVWANKKRTSRDKKKRQIVKASKKKHQMVKTSKKKNRK